MKNLFVNGLLKNVMPLLLGVAVLLQAFDKGLLWSGFYLNQQYIASELCENKDRPQLSCEGYCVLRKALEEMEDQKSKNRVPQEIKTEVLICQSQEVVGVQPLLTAPKEYLFPTGYPDYRDHDAPGLLKPPIHLVA